MVSLARSWLVLLLALVALLGGSRSAWAKGPLEIRPLVPGPMLELVPDQGRFSAKVLVENPSSKPVKLEVRVRDSAPLHPRLPAGLSAKLPSAGTSVDLAPGQKREVEVELAAARGKRVHEQYGHVLFFVGDDPKPLAMGFHLALPGAEWGLSGHLLSLLVALPLIVGIVLLVLRGRELWDGGARALVGGASIAQLLVLAWISSRFDVTHTRFLGSDGLQLMERLPLAKGLGIEAFLALDGISLALSTVVPALTAVVAFAWKRTATLAKTGGLMLLLNTGLIGALCSFDLFILFAFWLLACVACVLLVAFYDGRLARGLGVHLGVGALLVGAAFVALSSGAQEQYWIDGTTVPRSFNLVELAAAGGWQPASASWLGVHPVKVVYTMLFVGCAITLGVAPLHGWISATLSRAPAAPALLVVAGLPMLGAYGLLRVGYAALPTGTAWAAPGVGAFALAAAAWAVLGIATARERSRALASSAALHSALALLGLSALTVAGVQGVLIVVIGRALWVALLVLVAAPSSPLLGAAAAIGFAAIAGAPGTLSFLGDVAIVSGALPTRKLTALLSSLVLVLGAVAVARFYLRSRAEIADEADAHELDERVPMALALCIAGLGFWPRPLTTISEASSFDQAEYVNPPGVLEIAATPGRDIALPVAQLTGYSTAGSANEKDTVALSPLTVE